MKNSLLYLLFTVAVWGCFVLQVSGKRVSEKKSCTLTSLTVEGREAPMGLDERQPRFGWQWVSDRNGVRQTAYRLIVSSSREKAERCEGDVWDSGWVESDASQWVDPGKLVLQPNHVYFWRVRGAAGRKQTDWSPISMWTTGLLDDSRWQGEWIGTDSLLAHDSDARHSRCTGRYFRKEFQARGDLRRATVHVSGLGTYVLYINGRRVGAD